MWRINSVEEITTTTTASISEEEEDDDSTSIASYPSLQLNLNPLKVPFPEAGVDLIDTTVDDYQLNHHLIQENGVKCYDCQTWQQNWLFKKAKKMDNKSDIMLGYMAMIIAELPICMLIPNPIEKVFRPVIGDRDVDELSDLSEHNSVGSLDFSDDESDYEETIDTNDVMEMTSDVSKVEECQKVVPIIMTTISKTTNTIEKECNESKAIINMKVSVVSNKVKPIVKTVTKVPNYLPKELRVNDRDSGSDPYLVLRPGDACVQSAITVQFICRARGSKPLLYSWFKGDSLLQSDQHFRIFQSGEENILEIMNTSQEYSDQYSCVVYNRFGYQWCDFTLQVRNTSFVSNKCHKMPLKMTTTTVDNECEPKSEAVSEVSNITINPKHDKHKTRPFVIQRTWAERVAELNSKAQNKQNESNVEFKGDNKDCEEETRVSVPTLMTCTIAEREHKKWENPDIDWKDSPYSAENLNSRLQQRVLSLNSLNESSIERTDNTNDENEAESAFLSSNSKDMSRYRKDYYVKQQPMSRDETLRSFDENEYSNSKYFNLQQIQRKSSEDMSQMSETSNGKNSNETESENSDSLLPSVKDLVNRFSFNDQQNDTIPKLVDIKRKNSFSDSKFNNFSKNGLQTNNFKVHSLTARSLTKEFRQMSQLNLPRTQRNRMDINGHKRPVSLIESESSSPSIPCSPTNEGYASDESNTSSIQSNSGNVSMDANKNKANNERKYSPAILKRASYWQKRCENGLISDCAVNEDFPPMETIAK